MRDAAARGDAGAVIRLVRTARGWTLADLATRCRYSPSQVSRYERGLSELSLDARQRFAAALGGIPPHWLGLGSPEHVTDIADVTADPVTDLAHLGRIDVDRRGFITSAYSLPLALSLPAPALAYQQARKNVGAGWTGMVGRTEVTTVREITRAFTRADERLGGGAGRTAIAEYLATDATTYLHNPPADARVRSQMYGAVAELARLCGWKAHDQGREGLAQRYYLHAWQLASEADPAHAAFVLRLMAHQAIDLGHGGHAVQIAESALAAGRGRVDAATLGQLHLAAARAHAVAGHARAARAALTSAERRISAHTDGAERPWWASAMGAPQPLLATHTAKALADLGDPAAEQHLTTAATQWNPGGYPRVRALNLCDLGDYHARRGAIEPACQAWSEALGLLRGVTSARARTAVTHIRGALSPHHRRGGAAVARTDAMAAQWLKVSR